MTALSREARRLQASVRAEYDLDDRDEVILRVGLEALDEMRAAQRDLRQFGPTIEGRDGRKANPAALLVSRARADFLASLRALGLERLDGDVATGGQRTSFPRGSRRA